VAFEAGMRKKMIYQKKKSFLGVVCCIDSSFFV